MLVEKGSNINVLDFQGKSPLFLCVQQKEEKLANLLLKKGADPNLVKYILVTTIDLSNISFFFNNNF